MKLSVLIPSSDQVIKMTHLILQAKKSGADEIIVAIKPEHDAITKKYKVRTVLGGKSRGADYNAAARVATGDVLVLLHQNTIRLPKGLFRNIKKVMSNNVVIGGGVNIAFDFAHWMLSLNAFISNYYRMRLKKIIYCDQTIFVRKMAFKKMKGFKQILIFEDTDFSKRLRKQGKLVFLKGPVLTSAHRFIKNGIFFHTFRNQLLKLLYIIGVNPKILKQIYEFKITK